MVAQALACVAITARRFRLALSMAGTILPYPYSLHPNQPRGIFFLRTPSGERLSPFEGVHSTFDRGILDSPA